jgi:hypothetical protein
MFSCLSRLSASRSGRTSTRSAVSRAMRILHWHIAGLPSGVHYPQQQFHALMTENGVLSLPPDEVAEMAVRLRGAVAARGVLKKG